MAAQLYPQNGLSKPAVLATANTNYDGTGTLVTVATGTATGKDSYKTLLMQAGGTVSAGELVFFTYDTVQYVPFCIVPVEPWTAKYTAPNQTPLWGGVIDLIKLLGQPLKLPSTSHTVKALTRISETFYVWLGGDNFV